MTTTKNTAAQVEAINLSKDVLKGIAKNTYYSTESFIKDAHDYLNAIRENRMINVIGSVSSSGMSRTLKFTSCEHNPDNNSRPYYQRNYTAFFEALGYTEVKNAYGYFRVGGCGMDMIFHTNYTIIHRLFNMGFIDKQTCEQLAQQTPTTI